MKDLRNKWNELYIYEGRMCMQNYSHQLLNILVLELEYALKIRIYIPKIRILYS